MQKLLSNKLIIIFIQFRKHVTPKTCARKFTKYCDLNKDGEISAREWVTCLGIDISSKFIISKLFSLPKIKVTVGVVDENCHCLNEKIWYQED